MRFVPIFKRNDARLFVLVAVSLLAIAATAFAQTPLTQSALNTSPSIGAVGVNDIRSDGILLTQDAWNGLKDITLMQTAGIQLYRARLQLNCVDPEHTGVFNFSMPSASCDGLSYDALVSSLATHNITLLPVLINYNGSSPQPPTTTGSEGAPSVSEFAAFAAAAAARYGPGGSFWAGCGCAPHPVYAWEIWNEENANAWWGGQASARAYADVFTAVHTALRATSPQARVVVGGLVTSGHVISLMHILKAITDIGTFDAVAIHIYTSATSAGTLADSALKIIGRTAAELKTLPGPRTQLWITEIGWPNEGRREAVVADALKILLVRIQQDRAREDIGPVIWYDFRDNSVLDNAVDELGLRTTTTDGGDSGAKRVWKVFVVAANSDGVIPLPSALTERAENQSQRVS